MPRNKKNYSPKPRRSKDKRRSFDNSSVSRSRVLAGEHLNTNDHHSDSRSLSRSRSSATGSTRTRSTWDSSDTDSHSSRSSSRSSYSGSGSSSRSSSSREGNDVENENDEENEICCAHCGEAFPGASYAALYRGAPCCPGCWRKLEQLANLRQSSAGARIRTTTASADKHLEQQPRATEDMIDPFDDDDEDVELEQLGPRQPSDTSIRVPKHIRRREFFGRYVKTPAFTAVTFLSAYYLLQQSWTSLHHVGQWLMVDIGYFWLFDKGNWVRWLTKLHVFRTPEQQFGKEVVNAYNMITPEALGISKDDEPAWSPYFNTEPPPRPVPVIDETEEAIHAKEFLPNGTDSLPPNEELGRMFPLAQNTAPGYYPPGTAPTNVHHPEMAHIEAARKAIEKLGWGDVGGAGAGGGSGVPPGVGGSPASQAAAVSEMMKQLNNPEDVPIPDDFAEQVKQIATPKFAPPLQPTGGGDGGGMMDFAGMAGLQRNLQMGLSGSGGQGLFGGGGVGGLSGLGFGGLGGGGGNYMPGAGAGGGGGMPMLEGMLDTVMQPFESVAGQLFGSGTASVADGAYSPVLEAFGGALGGAKGLLSQLGTMGALGAGGKLML